MAVDVGGGGGVGGVNIRCARARVRSQCGPVTAAMVLLLRTARPPGVWTPVATSAAGVLRVRCACVVATFWRTVLYGFPPPRATSHPFAPPPSPPLPPPPPPQPSPSPQTTTQTPSIPADLETDVWNRTTLARTPSKPTYWELNDDILINFYRTVYKYLTPPPGPLTRVHHRRWISQRALNIIIIIIIRHLYGAYFF